MKKLLLLTITLTAITLSSCTQSQSNPLLDPQDIKGCEHWENGSEVGITLETPSGTYFITKEPYTTKTTVTFEE